MYTRIYSMSVVAAMVFTFITSGAVKTANAEMVEGVSLGAQQIVDTFNALNDGNGIFIYAESPASQKMDIKLKGKTLGKDIANGNKHTYIKNPEYADLSAYASNKASTKSGHEYFLSVNVAPAFANYYDCLQGYLHYDAATGTTSAQYTDAKYGYGKEADGYNALTIGAAYLYTQFATTETTYTDKESKELAAAIRYLIGDMNKYDDDNTSWETNKYLAALIGLNGDESYTIDYWESLYNPDAFYTEIGNYSVFALNLYYYECDYDVASYLYIANAATPWDGTTTASEVPEPSTMLILGLGMAVAPFARRLRRK